MGKLKTKQILRRVLCLFLTVVMVASLGIDIFADSVVYAKDQYGTKYTSISTAWNAAKTGKVIILMRDWKLSDRLVLNKGESATIDMNGLRIDRQLTNDDYESDGEVIYLDEGASLVLRSTVTTTTHDFTGWENGSRKALKITNGGLVTGGWSSNGAGGVHMKKNSTLILDNVAIAGNRAEITWGQDGYGGGVMMDGDNCTLTMTYGAQIAYNEAQDEGGGVYSNGTGSTISLSESSSINHNRARDGGGGIYFCYSEFVLESKDATGSISDNTVTGGHGGAIFTEQCAVSTNVGAIYGITMKNNTASECGGAIYLNQESTTISGCTIEDNSANEGGGIYVNNDDNTLSGCTIQNNTASSEGGGVFVSALNDIGLSGTLTIKNNNRKDGAKDDLFLNDTPSSNAYITGVPSGKSEIGIRTADTERKINKSREFYYEQAFFSDFNGYHIEFDGVNTKLHAVKGDAETVSFTEVDPEPTTITSYNNYPLIHGYFQYASIGDSESDLTSDFYYSDGYFLNGNDFDGGDPTDYNSHLATMSMTMAMASFGSNLGIDGKLDQQEKYCLDYTYKSANIEKLLTDIGITADDIFISDTYSVKPGVDTVGVAIGHKHISQRSDSDDESVDYTLIPIVVRSAGYESEWASNVTLGSSGEAKGFASAANQVYTQVQKYIDAYDLTDDVEEGRVKFWIMGYSRGGATSNLTAKRLIEGYCYDSDGETATGNQVYAYCFEAPQGGRNSEMKLSAEKYYCIHNCINKVDAVPEVAPDEMGFMRYGVDHYVPGDHEAEETPNENKYVWSFVAEQDWANSYETWYDNESWAVGSNNYKAQRAEMLEQLDSIDPVNITFFDNFEIAEMDVVPPSNDPLSYDGTPITQEQFIHIMIRAIQSWGLYNSSEGDLRDSYYSSFTNGDGDLYPSFESALQVLVPIVFAKSSEDLEGIMSSVMSGKDSLIGGLYGKARGLNYWIFVVGHWTTMSQSRRDGYLNQLWNELICTKNPLTGKSVANYLSRDEYNSLLAVWDMLFDVILRFVEVDYNNNINRWNESTTPTGSKKTTPVTEGYTGNQLAYGSHSLAVLGTLAYNTTVLAQGHYPEINFAWLRSYDSFYGTSKSKSNPVTIDMDSFDAPTVDIEINEGLVSIEADIEGAAVFYRITTPSGIGNWKPFNQPFTVTKDNTVVQATAIYCGKTSGIETLYADKTYYTVTVDDKVIGKYIEGATVTIDGTDKDRIFDEWTVESGDVILEDEYNAVTSFIMPDENVVLTSSYSFTRSKDVKLSVDKPAAEEELPTTGTFTWTVDGEEKTKENVPVYWIEQVDGNTQTATGKAKYGTEYTVAALIEQDVDNKLAFAFDLNANDAAVEYEGVDFYAAYDAYVDDAGSLRIYGYPVETEEPAWDIYLVVPTTLSVTMGLPEEDLIEKLPDQASVILSDYSLTKLSVDKSKADTSDVIEDGKVARDGQVTIPIPDTSDVLVVFISTTEEQVDEPIVEVENGEQTLESSTVENNRHLLPLTALYDITPLSADSNWDTKTFRNKTELKVTLSGGEDETIKYTIRKEGDNADDEPEVYTYTEPFTLTGVEGEKTTYMLTTWAEKGDNRSSDVTCTYILDNPYTVTINGTDTGLLGIQNKSFTDFPKTYYYYNGDKVTIAAPAEADELFEKWESVPDGVVGDEDDISLSVESMNGNIELTAIYNPVIKEIEMTIDTPSTGEKLATNLDSALVTVTETYEMKDYFRDIIWTPSDETAAADTVYTAKMMLDPQKFIDEAIDNNVPEEQANNLKYYLSEKLELNVNENDSSLKASVAKQNDAIYVTFSATDNAADINADLVSIVPFNAVAVTYEQAQAGEWNLPTEATLNLSDGSQVTASVTWTTPVFSSKSLSYTVTGTAAIPDTVQNPNNISNTVTIMVLVVAEKSVAAPIASVSSGTYDEIQYVYLYNLTDGAEIYYTVNGRTPSTMSTRYNENTTITISADTTLMVIAVKDGVTSEVATYTYTINAAEPDPTPAPTPTPVPSPTFPSIPTTKPNTEEDNSASDTTPAVTEETDTVKDGYAVCSKNDECPLAAYTDLDVGAWYHDGVHYCLENGIMNGYTADTFGPNDSITRAQAVTILWRIDGSSEAADTAVFSDVAQNTYYTTAVAWATENGIVLGYEDGTFHPNDNVTREQLAAILYRYAAFCGLDMTVDDTAILDSYSDAQSIGNWALTAMQWVCENGILNGTESGLMPQGTATRAQSAAIFQRFSVIEK